MSLESFDSVIGKLVVPEPSIDRVFFLVINGGVIYKKFFLLWYDLLNKRVIGSVSLPINVFYRELGVPSNASQYVIYKFVEAGLLRDVRPRSGGRFLVIEDFMRVSWADLIDRVSSNA
jgi:hypothetical protein